MNRSPSQRVIKVLATAAAAVFVGALTTSGVLAQPTQPADDAPRTRSPFWGDDAGRGDRDKKDKSGFNDAFPSDLAADVPVSKERYVGLRAAYRGAVRELATYQQQARKQYEQGGDFAAFRAELDAAQAALDQARADALVPLQSEPDYVAAGELQAQLARQIKEAHQQPRPDVAAIRGMSELSLKYATQRRAKEQAMTDGDPTIAAARDRLRSLAKRQAELEQQFDRDARGDDKAVALREKVEQLRVGYLAAGAHYDAAVRAADIAADFAYFKAAAESTGGGYGYQPYGYGGYGYGGYGYGSYGGLFYGGGTIIGGAGVGTGFSIGRTPIITSPRSNAAGPNPNMGNAAGSNPAAGNSAGPNPNMGNSAGANPNMGNSAR